MTSKDHLTPTPIVDKNGKWTTVYRKLFGSKKKEATHVPAPSIAPTEPSFDRAPSIENLRLRAEAGLKEEGQIHRMHQVMVEINKYPDDLLQRLNKAIDDDVPNMWMIDRQIRAGLPHNEISESLYFLPRMKNPLYIAAQKHLRSLHAYKQLPPSDDYSKESEGVRKQCLALMTVAKSAMYAVGEHNVFDGSEERTPYVLKDERLTDLILEYTDRATEISNIVEDRETVDPDVIRSILSSDAPALSEGML